MLKTQQSKKTKEFDQLLSPAFKKVGDIHWTPTAIVVKAAKWLGENSESKVLDIGSGVGKFCMVGAGVSEAHFTGVELRKNLVDEANKIKEELGLKKVSFLNQNITTVSFKEYDAFYFYNPFCEHTAVADWIDKKADISLEKLAEYENHIYDELAKKEKGTKLVTYLSASFNLPESYFAVEILNDGDLVFWEKRT